MADELSALKTILLRQSVRSGSFTLSAGQTSGVYVDGKLTTCSAIAMPLIGRAFLRTMKARGWFPEAVGGLTLGADPIAFAIARESLEIGRPINAFIVRKEPKKHGTQRFIEGLEETEGRRVVILDDVCTTGGSTARAIEKALEAEMRILGAICLVDREQGASELLENKFGCRLENIFTLAQLLNQEEPSTIAQPFERAT